MISLETRAQIRRHFYTEHWKIGTIAGELGVHPDTVRHAIEAERFRSTQLLRPSIVDPYAEFIRQTLDQYPRLRATRIYQMVRDRGYAGSVVQLRRGPESSEMIRQEGFSENFWKPATVFHPGPVTPARAGPNSDLRRRKDWR